MRIVVFDKVSVRIDLGEVRGNDGRVLEVGIDGVEVEGLESEEFKESWRKKERAGWEAGVLDHAEEGKAKLFAPAYLSLIFDHLNSV